MLPTSETARPLNMTETPSTSWAGVRQQVDTLRHHAVELRTASQDPADFMPAFCGEADDIVDAAAAISDDAVEGAHQAIDEILMELGYMDVSERQT